MTSTGACVRCHFLNRDRDPALVRDDRRANEPAGPIAHETILEPKDK
jgi:hypothetical protein